MKRPPRKARPAGKLWNGRGISDHARVRWVERVLGIPLEEIDNRIVPPEHRAKLGELGEATVPMGTHSVIVANGVVVTVITKHGQDS